MNFAYTIKNKMTIAIMLFCIMACSLLIRILEDRSIKEMNEAFVSMYNDRLIPATDLFYLAENVYDKRYLMEEVLYNEDSTNIDHKYLKERLGQHNVKIDSLINKYEGTFLVDTERDRLNELKMHLQESKTIESSVLISADRHSIEAGRTLFENQGKASFLTATKKLSELTRIQTQVGQELIKNSGFAVSGSNLYSSLQVALAIIIGILIVAIVFASNVVKLPTDKYNLN